MCGLFGWRLIKGDVDKLRGSVSAMAEAMAARGRDSWGIAQLAPDGKDGVAYHSVSTGLGSIPHKAIRPFCDVGLGHTRSATSGSIATKNAHPWQVGAIVGAHNGCIWDGPDLDKYQVDSQALLARIARLQPVDDLQGYGAVTWLSLLDGDPRLCAMSGGDLLAYRLVVNGGEAVAICWSSTLASIKWPANVSTRLLPKLSEGTVYKVNAKGELVKLKYKLKLQDSGVRNRLTSLWWDADECGEYHYRDRSVAAPSTPDNTLVSFGGNVGICDYCGAVGCDSVDCREAMNRA